MFGLFVENGPLAVDSNGKGKEVWLFLTIVNIWQVSKFMRLPTKIELKRLKNLKHYLFLWCEESVIAFVAKLQV